ncbi:uncharacterized protein LOC132270442 [Cornus florida]|uniref:uncharacterized protein LOC132270442 n=1 Tax=Cornus florida TaxID=4283 RepID=UPI00289F7F55|nr:uncharacterized protein LOC132270442 [Cornus florida]
MLAGSDKSGAVCYQCQQPGHYKSKCPMNLSVVSATLRACYGYGQQGHLNRDCPNLGAGTASSFAFASGFEVSFMDWALCVDTPVGVSVYLSRVMRDCSIMIAEQTFIFDLILLEMTNFDIILRMDWLASFQAMIDCFRGRVIVCTPEGDCLFFMGDQSDSQPSSLYGIRVRNRSDHFLASLLSKEDDDVEKVYPAVVCDFLDVFREDLTELSPHRKKVFAIDLMPGTAPISMALYRIALVEFEELKKQLDDLRMKDDAEAFGVLYVKEIVRLHGVPIATISDTDAMFL